MGYPKRRGISRLLRRTIPLLAGMKMFSSKYSVLKSPPFSHEENREDIIDILTNLYQLLYLEKTHWFLVNILFLLNKDSKREYGIAHMIFISSL